MQELDVLDRDRALRREGRHDADRALVERLDLRAPEHDHTHDPIGREHRHAHDRAEAAERPGLLEGYSGSAAASVIWTARRSSATRPTSEPRSGATG